MFNKEKKTKSVFSGGRPIDRLADEIAPWWQKKFTYVRKTKVKTWQGALVLAFVTGITVSIIWTTEFGLHIFSNAVNSSATLKIFPESDVVSIGETFPVDVVLDTKGNDVVVVRAIIEFNTSNFEFLDYDLSESIFSPNNECQHNGGPCNIFEDDRSNGKVGITLAKPTPGVNTSSGVVARFNFKSRNIIANSATDIKIKYDAQNVYTDSDVIFDDPGAADILQSAFPFYITVTAPQCEFYTYSDWGGCEIGNIQYRTIVDRQPLGCDPVNVQLSQSCQYESPICTSFAYSEWTECQPNNKQTRTVTSSSPLECVGGTPILEQSCQYIENKQAPTCDAFTYSNWSECQPNGKQTRTVVSSAPAGCADGNVIIEQDCTYTIPTCESFVYSSWTSCLDRQQKRSITGVAPQGCVGGQPILTQSCNDNKNDDKDDGKGKSSDKKKPKFVDFPLTLSKKRGEAVWWKATDNKKVSSYTIKFNGKTVKKRTATFIIPINTPRGPHILKVKASDKAGNNASRTSIVWVR